MRNLRRIMKIWTCLSLAVLLCVGSMTVGVSALQEGDYGNGEQRDDLNFLALVPESCSHQASGEWILQTPPAGSVSGTKVQLCTICQTPAVSEEVPYLKFQSAALALGEDLSLNYKVSKSLLTSGGYTDPYVVFVMGERTVTQTAYLEDGDYYVFPFTQLAPYLMNDNIEATLYATCLGTLCQSAPQNYSIATYCYNSLTKYSSNEYAELRTLLVDLLNYGAAVQTYMNYRTDALVNANLSETQQAWGTSTDRTLVSTQNSAYAERSYATVAWTGAGLTLKDSIVIRFKIDATDVTDMYAKVITSNGIHTIDGSEFVATTGGHYIFFDWFSAAQMSETFYVTLYDQTGAISNTLSYSVESYAYAKQSSTDANLVALVRAMMRYGDAAKEYARIGETASGGGDVNDQEGWTKPY